MAIAFFETPGAAASERPRAALGAGPALPRITLSLTAAAAAVSGFVATGDHATHQAVSAAGEELTHLLRAMAMLKALMAAGALAAVLWRMGSPVSAGRFAFYALACASMAAGPGLIWDMAHVGYGALLLHAGLLGALFLLWRDPAVGARLSALVEARRAAIAARSR